MKKNKTKKQSLQEKPLAPQIGQATSFDLTVITSDSFDEDEFDQEDVNIKIVPYIDEETPVSGEAVVPSSSQINNNQQRLKQVSKYSIHCGSISLSALKGAVILVLVLLLAVFIVVLAKSGKAFGKW